MIHKQIKAKNKWIQINLYTITQLTPRFQLKTTEVQKSPNKNPIN